MKTVNGVPQFETWEFVDPTTNINDRLREWAATRTCVNCTIYIPHSSVEMYWMCEKIDTLFTGYLGSPKTFSCAAFEEKK